MKISLSVFDFVYLFLHRILDNNIFLSKLRNTKNLTILRNKTKYEIYLAVA